MMMMIITMLHQATQSDGEGAGKVEPSLGGRDLVPGGSAYQCRPHSGRLLAPSSNSRENACSTSHSMSTCRWCWGNATCTDMVRSFTTVIDLPLNVSSVDSSLPTCALLLVRRKFLRFYSFRCRKVKNS